jgi:type I restriction enzyme S subunit
MVSDWEPARLGDLIKVGHGWPFKSNLYSNQYLGGPIVVSIGNFKYDGGFRFGSTAVKEYTGKYPPQYNLLPGDVVLIMTCQTAGGEILGVPARVPDDGRQYLHNQRIGRVVVRDERRVDARFLYWFFLSPKFNRELVRTASGTKILHTAPSRIESCSLELPPVPEQQVIARILDSLDDKIELNRRMNANLEATAQALFEAWFVDFEPVRARAEGFGSGLPSRFADLFPDEFEDSELGEIPRGWCVGNLGDLVEQRVERVNASPSTCSLPYVPIDCISSKSLFLEVTRPGDEAKSSLNKFYKGDVLFGAMRPYFHKVSIAPFDGTTRTTVFVLKPMDPRDFSFVTLRLHQSSTIDYATAHSTGTTIPYATWKGSLEKMPVTIPPAAIREKFDNIVGPILKSIPERYFQNRTLLDLRDAILPRLISGELRIKDAERILDGVA